MKTLFTAISILAIFAAAVVFLQPWSGNGGQVFAVENPVAPQVQGSATKKDQPQQAAVQDEAEKDKELKRATYRARQTVKMLDDIYKGSIVAITDKYVTEDSEIPAGTAFKEIFAVAKAKGWHEARLLDVTGDPISEENVAIDDFEKRAVKKIAKGEAFYEEVEEVDGQKFFRAMTAIPVVFEKCTWCHSNYEDLPQGQAIGAMGYKIKIELDSDIQLPATP